MRSVPGRNRYHEPVLKPTGRGRVHSITGIMLSIITLPTNFIGSTTATMSDLITDLGSYITLILGVILAVVVIEILINAIRK